MTTDNGQQALIERAAQVLGGDDRVRGVWLLGSYARGTNDSFSDVDLWVVVGPDDFDGFCADWPKLSDAIAPTVIRRQLGTSPIFTQVTTDWLRFDVSVARPDQISSRTRTTAKPLHDPDGLSGGLSAPGPPLQPDAGRVSAITQEFLRVAGLLPVAMGREEYVVGESGACLLRNLLVDLMLQDVAVEDRGGALHLKDLLPPGRLRTLTDLPPLQATRESVIAAHIACAGAFLPLARDLHARCGLEWPQELEEAARRHLATTLSVELPA